MSELPRFRPATQAPAGMPARTAVLRTLACCVAVVLALLAARAVLDLVFASAKMTSGTCAGDPYDVTLSVAADELIMVQVVVTGDPGDRWQVRWGALAEEQPDDEIVVGSNYTIATVTRPLGDVDDGAQRDVWLRRTGTADWCKIHAVAG